MSFFSAKLGTKIHYEICPLFFGGLFCVEILLQQFLSTVTEEEEEHHDDDKEHQFLHLISNYPNRTFDPNWEEGCYYVVPDEEKKWGEGCHFKKYWEDPIRFVLVVFSSVNLLLLVRCQHFVFKKQGLSKSLNHHAPCKYFYNYRERVCFSLAFDNPSSYDSFLKPP